MTKRRPIFWLRLRRLLRWLRRHLPWRRISLVASVVICLCAISTCSPRHALADRIRSAGSLRVASTTSPATCYRGHYGPLGYQCALLRKFATHLGVGLHITYVRNRNAALTALREGRVDLAIGVMPDMAAGQALVWSPPVQMVRQQLVYSSPPRPGSLDTLKGKLAVAAGSAAEAALESVSVLHHSLHWQPHPWVDAEDLLYRVASGQLDYTVAGSDLVKLNQRFYPNLYTSLSLTSPQAVGWAVRRSADESLGKAMRGFFTLMGKKWLTQFHKNYFANNSALTYQDIVGLTQDYVNVLPEYRSTFVAAGIKNDVDWRLMAAIGYQESHWIPSAVSPTGVHGLMMLTLPTAAQVNVADRSKAKPAIRGGTRYFSWLMSRIPFSVARPDRMWMAAAAWNMGLGHLFDARAIAQQRGGNPNLWADVRAALPLLTEKKWYAKARYGYGQGYQALTFVDNVRSYYDILVWLTNGQPQLMPAPASSSAPH